MRDPSRLTITPAHQALWAKASDLTVPSVTPAKPHHPGARLKSLAQHRREKALETSGEVETLEPEEDAPELSVAPTG